MLRSVKQFVVAALLVIILEEATPSPVGTKTSNINADYIPTYGLLINDVSDFGPSRRILEKDIKADSFKHFNAAFNGPIRSEEEIHNEIFAAGAAVFQPPTVRPDYDDGHDQIVQRRPGRSMAVPELVVLKPVKIQ